jgi:hypothetical protein
MRRGSVPTARVSECLLVQNFSEINFCCPHVINLAVSLAAVRHFETREHVRNRRRSMNSSVAVSEVRVNRFVWQEQSRLPPGTQPVLRLSLDNASPEVRIIAILGLNIQGSVGD